MINMMDLFLTQYSYQKIIGLMLILSNQQTLNNR